jgi:hypothetical protein
MRAPRARWRFWVTAVSIVMLELVVPRRGFAQWRAETLPGLRFGPPMRAGFALGVAYGTRTTFAQFAGPLALAELGVGGGRVSAGYLLAGPLASGFEVLGSAIRTWGNTSQAAPGQTLVGGEVRVSFFLLNLGVGVFRPMSDWGSTDQTRYYLNLGLGI